MRAPERRGVKDPGRVHVVDEAAEPLQQPRVLVARMRAPMLRVVIASAATRGRRGGGGARAHERFEREVEADARRLDEARADLPDPRSRLRHPGVDSAEDPVWTTRRTSIPVGVPRKSSAGRR